MRHDLASRGHIEAQPQSKPRTNRPVTRQWNPKVDIPTADFALEQNAQGIQNGG